MTDQAQVQNNIGGQDESEFLSDEKKALLIEMSKAGIFYGRRKSKTHPRMKQFVYATRNGIEIIDVAQTLDRLDAAAGFLRSVAKEGNVLVVGVKPSIKVVLENFAKKYKFPFVVERWIGGLLTNFKVIRTRIEYFIKLKEDKESGRLDKYTKKERLNIDRQLEKMEAMFGGVQNMSGLPKALFVVDPAAHKTAVREALRLGIPIIAIMNTDSDPDAVAYPVPANTNTKASIEWILNYLSKNLESGI